MNCTGEHKHELKICQRCKTSFVCKAGDVSNCQCSAVKLSADEQRHFSEKFDDCLCGACLKSEQHAYAVGKFNASLKLLLRQHE